MGLPPLLKGAEKVTVACALPPVAVPMTGASGTVATGVTVLEDADAGPLPIELLAITIQLTGTPFVRPITVIGEATPVALTAPQVTE